MEGKTIEVHKISEVPKSVFDTLYALRLRQDAKVPYEDYIRFYSFITIDGALYTSDDEDAKARERRYIMARWNSSKRAALPDAVVVEGIVLKNRYGNNSTVSIPSEEKEYRFTGYAYPGGPENLITIKVPAESIDVEPGDKILVTVKKVNG